MNDKKNVIIAVLATICLMSTMFALRAYGAYWPYNPWWDITDDGKIDIQDLARVSGAFGTTGTPLTKASIEYDSGWINITDKCGQYFNIPHNLNNTNIIVDMQGKTEINGPVHQRYLDLAGYTDGWNNICGSGSRYENIYSVIQTRDGGYMLTGFGYVLYKTDANGILQWTTGELGAGEAYWAAYSIVQTVDLGYALAGTAWGTAYDSQGRIVKADSDGRMEWNKTYGGANEDYFLSIIVSNSGGFALGGSSNSYGSSIDAWFVKTDYAGTVAWNRTYGGGGTDEIRSIVQTQDGGYTLLGYTNSYGAGNYDYLLIGTDSDGNTLWNKTYGGTNDDVGRSLIKTIDGGYAMAGYTDSFGSGYSHFWLVKTDANGNVQWSKTYGEEDHYAYAHSLVQTSEGGYALVGGDGFYNGSSYYSGSLLVKTDSEGNQQWNRTYFEGIDFANSKYSWFVSLVEARDGALILGGEMDDKYNDRIAPFLLKTDTEFGITWTSSDPNNITVYRGATDPYWNYVRVRIWTPKTP